MYLPYFAACYVVLLHLPCCKGGVTLPKLHKERSRERPVEVGDIRGGCRKTQHGQVGVVSRCDARYIIIDHVFLSSQVTLLRRLGLTNHSIGAVFSRSGD